MKKILFFLSAFPFPIDDGIKKIVDNLIRESKKSYKVTLVVPKSEYSLAYEDEIEIVYYSKSRDLLSMVKDLLFLQPLYFSLYYDKSVLERINKESFDLIFYDFYPMTQYSSGLKQEVFMMPDSMKLLAEGTAKNSQNILKKIYHNINYLLAKQYNKKIEKLKKLYVSKFDIEIDNLKNSYFIKIPADEIDYSHYWKTSKNLREISFRGVMSFEPNITAVKTFYEDIYRDLIQKFPETTLKIIGKDPSVEILNLKENIEITGFVDDPLHEMSKSYIHIAPMVSGSGVKTKLLDSFALKRLVFTNKKGINGIFDSIEEARENGVIVYENKEQFISFYEDLFLGKVDYEESVEKAFLFIKKNSYKKLLNNLFSIAEY